MIIKKDNTTLEYSPLLLNEQKLTQDILESFEYSKIINDIESIEFFYNKTIYLIKKDNLYLGFIYIYYKPSLNAYGFNVYIHENTSPRLFKMIVEYSCPILCQYSYNQNNTEIYNFYFDVPNNKIAKWVKEFSQTLKIFNIYENYIICFTTLKKEQILRIINSYEIILC